MARITVGCAGSLLQKAARAAAAVGTDMVRKSLFQLLTFCLLELIVAFPALSQQQAPSLSLTVVPKAGSTDESFILTVKVEDYSGDSTPFLIGGDDFEAQLLGIRPQAVIGASRITTSVNFTYRLTPKREGILDSPSAEMETGGVKLTAPSVKVRVDKGLAPLPGQMDEPIFLRQTVDKLKPFVGEQVLYVSSLYLSAMPMEPQFSDTVFDGFWNESMGEPVKTRAYVNGVNFIVVKASKALFPLRSGEVTVPSRSVEATVQEPLRFNYRRVTITSNALELEVRDLPPQPADFENWQVSNVLVGPTSLKAEYDASEVKTGDSKSITVELSSEGNVNPYERIQFASSPDYKIYQDESKLFKTEVAGKLESRRVFKFSVVPLRPGTLTMPPIKLGYFDPASESYSNAEAAQISFNVTGTDLRSPVVTKPIPLTITPSPNEQTVSSPELKYSEPTWSQRISSQISLSMSLLVLSITAFLLYLFYLLRTNSVAAAPLKRAWREFYSSKDVRALAKNTDLLIALLLTRESSPGITARELADSHVSDPELRAGLHAILDDIDSLRFSSAASDHGQMTTILKRTEKILKSI